MLHNQSKTNLTTVHSADFPRCEKMKGWDYMLKKVLSLLLAASVTAVCLPAAEAAGGLPIEETFENSTGMGSLSWSNQSYLSLTEGRNGGTGLRLSTDTEADGSKYTDYRLSAPISGGAVKISYSFKPGENISTMFCVYDSDGNRYCPTFISEKGQLSIGRGNASETAELLNAIYRTDCDMNIWYDAECIIDLDDQTTRITVTDENGKKITTRLLSLAEYLDTDFALKDISLIRLQIWNEKNCSSVFDNIKIAEEPISYNITTDNIGNVFGTDEAAKMKITLKNNTSSKYAVTPEWTVKNSDGEIVKSGSDSIIAKSGTSVYEADVDVEKNGIYTFECKLTCEKLTGASNTVIKNETTEFTKILSSGADEKNEFFGFATHLGRWGSYEKSIDLMNKIGSAGWRDEKQWAGTESVKGEYGFDETWQGIMNKSTEKNISNVMVLAFGNTVYQDNLPEEDRNTLRIPTREDDIKAFAEYCRVIVKETKHAVGAYEIWNEYDGGFNKGTTNKSDSNYNTRGNTDNYIAILKAASEVIREEAPDAEIIGLGGAGLQFSLGRTFIDEFFKKGGYKYCDAISVHPYDRTTYFPNEYWVNMQTTLKKYMNTYKVDMPIYITEMGRSTAIDSPNQANHPMCDEESLAVEVVKVNAFARAKDLADRIYWYDFMDDGEDTSDEESCFGVVSWTRNQEKGGFFAKPALVSIAAMNNLMSGEIKPTDMYIEEKVKSDSTATDHHNGLSNYKFGAYCFERPEKNDKLIVIWNDLTKASTTLNLGCESIDVYDIYGNKTETLNSASGIYTVDASDTLIYITGDIKKLEYAKSSVSEIQKGVTVTADRTDRSITVDGKVLNAFGNERATLIAVPKGSKVSPENILYIREIQFENGEFNHKFTIPQDDTGSFDIYVGATNAYRVKTDGTESAWTKVVSVTVDESANDKVTGCVKLLNNETDEKTVTVILAQYSAENRLVAVNFEEVTIPGGTDTATEKTVSDAKNDNASRFTCYVWDNFTGMKPLY